VQTRAKLLRKKKQVLNSGLVREITIWNVPISIDYPEGIKYRLILVDPFWKKVIVLFDNHSPKGHHRHDDKTGESPYKFVSVQKILHDFLNQCDLEEELYESNEN
jgi:hypothetical protein